MDAHLKDKIREWMDTHKQEWQRVNACIEAFRTDIFDDVGNYLPGGEEIVDFIKFEDTVAARLQCDQIDSYGPWVETIAVLSDPTKGLYVHYGFDEDKRKGVMIRGPFTDLMDALRDIQEHKPLARLVTGKTAVAGENIPTTRIYEDNRGGIHAIVEQNGTVTNVLANPEWEPGITGEKIIAAAMDGFPYADAYDPENFSGLKMPDAADEISLLDELIAEVRGSDVTFYHERMGVEGRALFENSDAAHIQQEAYRRQFELIHQYEEATGAKLGLVRQNMATAHWEPCDGVTPAQIEEAYWQAEQWMQNRPRLFVDMDGTLARFHDEVQYLERMYEPDFFTNLKPFLGAVETVREVMRVHPDWEVYILSAAIPGDPPGCEKQKNAWLDMHLPEIDRAHRLFPPIGADKSEVIPGGIKETDVLLDDYNKNLEEWRTAGGVAVKFVNNINDRALKGPRWDGWRLHHDNGAAFNVEQLERCVINDAPDAAQTTPVHKPPRGPHL